MPRWILLFFLALRPVHAQEEMVVSEEVDVIEVVGRAENLIGVATSASQGTVGPEQLDNRPYMRPGEVLETVPGVIVTQHSGSGKANQFFLRGFNLDHGTDFTAIVDGVPINNPTHGHGQGYLDLNFLIPELIERVDYGKGPYDSSVGDFSSAGHARIRLKRSLDQSLVLVTGGEHDYYRALAAHSFQTGEDENVLVSFERTLYQGPWDLGEDLGKNVAQMKFTKGDDDQGISLTALHHDASWRSTDQIPKRAVDDGRIPFFGNVDPTDGGDTYRTSLYGQAWWNKENSRTSANVYWAAYALELFSNFSYFLDDPELGDQFQQTDRRDVFGGDFDHTWWNEGGGRHVEHRAGLQLRRDDIDGVGLRRTSQRIPHRTIRDDAVEETMLGLFYTNQVELSEKLRLKTGIRNDFLEFDVTSRNLAENSGRGEDEIFTYSTGLAYQIDPKAELYVNHGTKFHSNDVRGVTIRIDPATGDPADPVPALVKSRGSEVGVRVSPVEGLTSTLTYWDLELASELLFVGDAGATEATRGSKRHGIEWTNFYQVYDWLAVFADYSYSRARFRGEDPAGDRIPGALENVVAAGVNVDRASGWFGALNLRHFGTFPLIEDNSQRTTSTSLVNLEAGKRLGDDFSLQVDVLNLFDSRDRDITYFYTSRLPGEPDEGVDDVHFHPVIPRETRVTLKKRF